MKSNGNMLQPYLTMKIGGPVSDIIPITDPTAIPSFVEQHDNIFILGGGSNTIFSETFHDVFVGKIEISGIDILADNKDGVILKIGAGVNWDELVDFAVSHNYQGIEALSAIPGTVGATPIQNVGAYGTEIKNTLLSVNAYDRGKKEFVEIQNKDCSFGYRDSLFKHVSGRFIITHIILKLKKQSLGEEPPIPSYKGVADKLAESNSSKVTLKNIREAIIEIRKSKLPDPRVIPNSGSFFKNPRVSKEVGEQFIANFPDAPYFIEEDNLYKIPAGWLLEQTGFKNYPGSIGTYKHNALVVVNNGGNFDDLINLVEKIKNTVKNKFSIDLEVEPLIVL